MATEKNLGKGMLGGRYREAHVFQIKVTPKGQFIVRGNAFLNDRVDFSTVLSSAKVIINEALTLEDGLSIEKRRAADNKSIKESWSRPIS